MKKKHDNLVNWNLILQSTEIGTFWDVEWAYTKLMIRLNMVYASIHASPTVTTQVKNFWTLKATSLLQLKISIKSK